MHKIWCAFVILVDNSSKICTSFIVWSLFQKQCFLFIFKETITDTGSTSLFPLIAILKIVFDG